MSKGLEALKALDRNIVVIREKDYTIIEQALIKAQEQEKENKVLKACIKDWEDDYEHLKFAWQKRGKALEIIKKKGIDYHSISAIKQSKDYEDYLDLVKNLITVVFKLTQEEFDLLKEVFG